MTDGCGRVRCSARIGGETIRAVSCETGRPSARSLLHPPADGLMERAAVSRHFFLFAPSHAHPSPPLPCGRAHRADSAATDRTAEPRADCNAAEPERAAAQSQWASRVTTGPVVTERLRRRSAHSRLLRTIHRAHGSDADSALTTATEPTLTAERSPADISRHMTETAPRHRQRGSDQTVRLFRVV